MAEPDDVALEKATLRLINAIALASGTRAHSRRLRAVTAIDLPPSDLRFLELLSGRETMATSVIARELAINIAQASRQATQLEAAGHVVRSTDPQDRRRTLVALSEETATLLDNWLLAWSLDYLGPVATWTPEQIELIANWFALVHHRLVTALPDRPQPSAADRWLELAGDEYEPATRFFLHTMIGIATWVGLSRGFDDLLTMTNAPINQLGFLTLNLVATSGPLSIAEVAERLAIDPSQASKRLTELTKLRLVDRAVDSFDRRSNLVRASRKGTALVNKVFDVQMSTFGSLTTDLQREDRERWTPYVEAYVAGMLNRRVGADGLVRSSEPEVVTLH